MKVSQHSMNKKQRAMPRIAKKFHCFRDAEAWEKQQALSLTADERLAVASALRKKVYGNAKDIRECR